MNFKKLKNQKGITGIDVVIAITIISITTIAIVSLYTNVIVSSKEVTRTSAATRVATSIIENIETMYFAEVEKELARLSGYCTKKNSDEDYTLSIPSTKGENIFTSKLNAGYDVELDVEKITSGSARNGSGVKIIKDCPLVLSIKVKVKYKVSNITKDISLSIIKKMELLNECNEPDLNLLLKAGYSLNQINPIKWSDDVNSYIKTNVSNDWYSYQNKEWAKVLIPKNGNSTNDVFDLSTTAVKNIDENKVYMWIPRFGKTNDSKIAFTYKNSNDIIQNFGFEVKNYSGETKNFFFKGVALYDGTNFNKTIASVNGFEQGVSGIWVDISGGNLNTSDDKIKSLVKELNNSEYGPTISHISGKKYY